MISKEDEIMAEVDELFVGDIIEIIFLDASKTWNVKNVDKNAIFARYKKLIGRYWCVRIDRTYGVQHLIVRHMLYDEVIYSIPFGMLMRLRVLTDAKFSEVNDVGFMILTGKQIRPIITESGIGEKQK